MCPSPMKCLNMFFDVSSPLWVGFDFRHFFVPVFELSITTIGQERHKGFWHHKLVWSVVLCLTDLKLFSKAPLFCCLTHVPSMKMSLVSCLSQLTQSLEQQMCAQLKVNQSTVTGLLLVSLLKVCLNTYILSAQ